MLAIALKDTAFKLGMTGEVRVVSVPVCSCEQTITIQLALMYFFLHLVVRNRRFDAPKGEGYAV